MQQMRVHNPAFVPLEETSARNERRWDTLLAYATKIDDAWLVMRIKEGRCKAHAQIDTSKQLADEKHHSHRRHNTQGAIP